MRTEQLEYFVMTAELHSINKAADQLYVAQSTLSTALKKLEEEIGGDLLIKSYQGVALTDLGQTVYTSAKNILREITLWRETALLAKLSAAKTVLYECRLSVTPESVRSFLFKAINAIQADNPTLHITIKEGDFWQNIEDVSLSTSDCAITTIWEKAFLSADVQNIITNNGLYVDRLQECKTVALVHSSSPHALKKKLSIQEALRNPLVLYNTNIDPHWYQNVFQDYGLLRIGLLSNSARACSYYMAENQTAVMLVNELAARAFLLMDKNSDHFIIKPLCEAIPYLYIYISRWENRESYGFIKALIEQTLNDYLTEVASEDRLS